ncbi:hypothetical protein LOTGIDRAFT_116555 [Lottia gigantea]|uniref:Sulfotransferase domain-containing protein n=1 Tax=Lottia gigantea TaxID=225164 RepID=V4C2I8_LOTGI|nr:hypothetical protein LOTGIDRAFT_116555 [Lottia gigantea]ESO95729.1 hypothetical protein LOTGIDRAFT_116555 [Lottia gigantea]
MEKQIRIILWCTPRSASTAFVRAMESVPDIELFVEPYIVANHFGPERRMDGLGLGQSAEREYTFSGVRKKLEAGFTDKKVVFVKDMGYAVDGKYKYIPKGYKHCILIRNPLKSLTSYYKQVSKQKPLVSKGPLFGLALPSGVWYKELCDLADHLEKTTGERPMVIDAEDLISHPESIMRIFCDRYGLTFTPSMLTWNGERRAEWNMAKCLWKMHEKQDWHKNTFESTGFGHTVGRSSSNANGKKIPNCVSRYAKESQKHYQQLYDERVVPV